MVLVGEGGGGGEVLLLEEDLRFKMVRLKFGRDFSPENERFYI